MRRSSLIVISLIFAACVAPVRFEGTSMMPTIKDGDRLFIDTNFGELARGDIVMHRFPPNPAKFYIKRIVGLPGERIEIRNGAVSINGSRIDESYVDPQLNSGKHSDVDLIIEPGHYFVLGDNRDNSSDSRSWGAVERSLIVGKYRLTYKSSPN